MLTDTQTYIEAVENILAVNGSTFISPAEHNFAAWAARNIRSYEQTAWEILRARQGGIRHPALDIMLTLEAHSEEPLPFLI